jgi:V/A-type H+-transporting ATPase subunit I
MLRPEQMSKLSVTGSKRVMGSVVETVHGLNLLHVSEYNGSWEGFEQGNPEAEAEWASEKLVTVRSVESMLGVTDDDAEGRRIVTDDAIEEQFPEIRDEANSLDDRRDELRDELRAVEERIDGVQPFVDLGFDLDLLSGYDNLEVAVGEGDAGEVERALLDNDDVNQFDIETSDDGPFAVFVYPSKHAEEGVLEEALVGTGFNTYEVPEFDGAPESYLRELESERQQLRSEMDEAADDIDRLRHQHAEFLLAAEEKLSVDVQKAEAPLSFATTENAFIAEGWIPTDEYTAFKSALTDELGDSVDVEEVERASFKSDGDTHHEAVADGGRTAPPSASTDGGTAIGSDDPPVIQDNNGFVQPFEVLVRAVSRPKYNEFDPTALVFLTFPAFFGFMIGDLGYGLLYSAIGGFLYTNYDSDGIKSMGGVTLSAGLFTMLFGVLYGEIFGLHILGDMLFNGNPPLHKGLQPAYSHWATAWVLISAIAALVHLNLAYLIGFAEELEFHGLKAAVLEKGSFMLGMNGLWIFIFSRVGADTKPEFIFTAFASGEEAAFNLGFTGFSEIVGYLGLAMFLVGFAMLFLVGIGEVIEVFDMLVNVLSYARLSAVLLAKAGMAFVVNLLFFGVWVDEKGAWHYGLEGMPNAEAVAALGPGETLSYHGEEVTDLMFGGLYHGDAASLILGIVILILGHLLVLALGVTSAGLQSVRLEYYEFFSKFYDGGGRAYEPFGYERVHSNDE